MFEEMVDPVIVIDHLGVMHYVNNATEQLTGFDSRNLKGRNVNILMTASALFYALRVLDLTLGTLDDREHHDTYIKNFVASGRTKIIGIGKDVVLQRKVSLKNPIDEKVSVPKVPCTRRIAR
jgi:nitrogen-specific signal transduction histidine kinase